jgi:hypothetical protein
MEDGGSQTGSSSEIKKFTLYEVSFTISHFIIQHYPNCGSISVL